MEHEESCKLNESFTIRSATSVPESGSVAFLSEPSESDSLPSKNVGIKSHTFSEQIPAALDTMRLSDEEINMLTVLICERLWSEIKLQVVCMMLNIPLKILDMDLGHRPNIPTIRSIFYVYNVSGRFSRTIHGDSLAAVCYGDDEIKNIHQILRNGKQVLTGSDSITGSTTTERCLKGSLERSKTSECSHMDQITSISNTTPLSSLEIEVLAIHVSKSWKSLAAMFGVEESKIEKMIPQFLTWRDEYVSAVILLYLYNESDNFSREKLVQNCKKFGISDVEERLKRVRLYKVSRDNSKMSGSGDLSVSDTTRLSWLEIGELSWYICDSPKFAEVLPISLNPVVHKLPPSQCAAALLYVYNESDCFSRETLGKYLDGSGRSILQKKFECIQNIPRNSSDLCGSKTRTEEDAQDKSWSELTFPLQSTLDSKRLSRGQIEVLSEIVCHEWQSLAYMLDIPILTVYRPFYMAFELAELLLFLYNENSHFSRGKLEECCKKFSRFKKISEILRMNDSATIVKTLNMCESYSSSEEEGIEMSSNEPRPCETGLQVLSLQSSANDEGSETSKCNIISPITEPSFEDKADGKCHIDEDTFQYVKARSLALRFMATNPSCVRAIPYQASEDVDDKSISMCLYLYTYGKGIPAELRKASEDMFVDYKLEYFDLNERAPLGEFVAPRFCNNPSEIKEMANLAAIIENNLPLFENRLNVTAVQPSYKISSSREEDELCVTVYVLGKGKIPVGEEEFSEKEHLGNCRFNIVEGYFVPTGSSDSLPFIYGARPLHFGVGIGVAGKDDAGTLGVFLKDEDDNKYILSCEHVLGKGAPEKVKIVQPAGEDSRSAEKELSKKIEENKVEIIKNEQWMQGALDQRERDRLSNGINMRNLLVSLDEEQRRDAVSRDIATYSDGLRGNWEYEGQKIFVDVAVAHLNPKVAEEITWKTNKKGTVFGFNEEKSINGKIIDLCAFKEDNKEIAFWKSGRSTGHTEGGRLCYRNVFVQKGDGSVRCFGKLTHCNFMVYCELCAKKEKSDLVDVSLLKDEDRKCTECKKTIPKEKKALRLWARNCFIILNPNGPFSDSGDSGAVIFDDEGNAWGIIIGTFRSGHFIHTVAIPLDIAIKALNDKSKKKFSILYSKRDDPKASESLPSCWSAFS